MLSLQFQGINFNYLNSYHYEEIENNFINNNKQLVYSITPVSQIEAGVSLKQDLQDALDSYLANPNNPAPVIRDLRNKYILGSDLLKMRKNFEKSTIWNLLPQTFKKQWKKQINVINYLTNENANNNDLLISFGIIPYQEQNELPFIKLNIEDFYDLDFSHNNAIRNSYDNSTTQTFNDSCFSNEVTIRQTIYGINANSSNFIKPNLINSKFKNFINLNIDTISTLLIFDWIKNLLKYWQYKKTIAYH